MGPNTTPGVIDMIKRIARAMLRLIRWRLDGELPPHPKMVVVAAPHTSNWDFPLAMVVAPALGVRIRWLGKHTLFRKPYAWFFRMLGGIPVNRGKAAGIIGQSVAAFDAVDELVLVITPEGTRSKREYWKSGFYRIATAAAVPIVLVGVDGEKKTIRIGPDFIPSGDVKQDMDRVRAFIGGNQGIKPERIGPIRLRDEE